MPAEVTRRGVFSMQICVPEKWTDEKVREFANNANECGTENGWFIRREGDKALHGDPERQPCKQRTGHVHIMLDA